MLCISDGAIENDAISRWKKCLARFVVMPSAMGDREGHLSGWKRCLDDEQAAYDMPSAVGDIEFVAPT